MGEGVKHPQAGIGTVRRQQNDLDPLSRRFIQGQQFLDHVKRTASGKRLAFTLMLIVKIGALLVLSQIKQGARRYSYDKRFSWFVQSSSGHCLSFSLSDSRLSVAIRCHVLSISTRQGMSQPNCRQAWQAVKKGSP